MLRKYLSFLMAPADALGGGTAVDVPPNAIGDFMSGLPSLDDSPPEKKEEKPDGGETAKESDTADKPDAGAVAEAAAAARANTAKDDKGKPATDANANKPAADKPADKPGDGDDKWPRSSGDWETFKKRRAEEREKAKGEITARDSQIAELQAQLKTVQETGATGKEDPEIKGQIERLQKENEALTEQIRMADVTQHPKWKAHFGALEQEQNEIATAVLGEEKAKAFMEIVSIPNTPNLREYKKAKMDEFSADLTSYEQRIIGNVEAELMKLDMRKQQEIKNNAEHVSKLKETQQTQGKAQIAAKEKLFATTIAQLSDPKTGLAMFQKKDGNDEWNKQVDAMTNDAKRYFFGAKDLKAEDVAKAAMHAAAMPTLLKAWESDLAAKEKEIATLQAQVKKLSAAQPGGSGRGGEGGAGEGGAGNNRQRVEPGMTPEQATANLIKGWTSE